MPFEPYRLNVEQMAVKLIPYRRMADMRPIQATMRLKGVLEKPDTNVFISLHDEPAPVDARMIFIGVALLIAAGLALAVNAQVGAMLGLSQQQVAEALVLVLVLIVVAGGAFARRRRASELVVGLLLWIGLFGVVLTGYAYRGDIMSVATRVYGELAPGQPVVDHRTGAVSIRRGLSGHFEVDARINGAAIPLLFDTGASAMVLTSEDARKAGIDPGSLRFDTAVSTANGVGKAAMVTLDTIDIGGIVRHRIRAYVTAGGALDTSLLGMTFLETLSRYVVTPESLELTD